MPAHHAYIYEGSMGELEALAADARKAFGFAGEHNPMVHVRAFEKFGIEESRWLTDAAAFKASGGGALFVLGVSGISSEAQQALLKLFEEPQAGVVFVLLAPHGTLLPTLRSRMLAYAPVSPLEPEDTDGAAAAKRFLKLSGKDRSDFLVKLLKDDDGVKDRVRDFINALETELAARPEKSADVRRGLEDISMVRDYLRDRAPSLKMLLEHLALSLPSN